MATVSDGCVPASTSGPVNTARRRFNVAQPLQPENAYRKINQGVENENINQDVKPQSFQLQGGNVTDQQIQPPVGNAKKEIQPRAKDDTQKQAELSTRPSAYLFVLIGFIFVMIFTIIVCCAFYIIDKGSLLHRNRGIINDAIKVSEDFVTLRKEMTYLKDIVALDTRGLKKDLIFLRDLAHEHLRETGLADPEGRGGSENLANQVYCLSQTKFQIKYVR